MSPRKRKTERRGGARSGAGRKPITPGQRVRHVTLQVSGTPDQLAKIAAAAEAAGMSRSRWTLNAALREAEKVVDNAQKMSNTTL